MSYFNEFQLEHMRELANIPPEKKCWCGWYPVGECDNTEQCKQGKSSADKMKVWCHECHNIPPSHNIRCSQYRR